jgi:hypothetical protein
VSFVPLWCKNFGCGCAALCPLWCSSVSARLRCGNTIDQNQNDYFNDFDFNHFDFFNRFFNGALNRFAFLKN